MVRHITRISSSAETDPDLDALFSIGPNTLLVDSDAFLIASGTSADGANLVRGRFARLATLPSLKPALREEAEAVAREARANLSTRGTGELARSIEVIDKRVENGEGFAVGTSNPAGLYVEFGAFKRAGNPWLLPALHARLPRLKHNLRRLLENAIKSRSTGRS